MKFFLINIRPYQFYAIFFFFNEIFLFCMLRSNKNVDILARNTPLEY